METNGQANPRLYPRLLGPSWDALDEAVRHLHCEGEVVRAEGTFQVRHGTNRLARWLVRLARLPAAGADVAVRLAIIPHEDAEEWRRSFGDRPLVSFQWKRADGLLAEQMGPLEIRFRLAVSAGALVYHFQSAALRLGPLRLSLPRWLAPRVSAWEKPAAGRNQTHVSVEVGTPLLGLLVAYEGTMTRVEAGE